MGRIIVLIIFILTMVAISGCSGKQKNKNKMKKQAHEYNHEYSGSIQLSGAFALYPIVVKWAEEFKKINPEVRIDISGGGAGKGIADVLANVVNIGMVSRAVHDEELAKGAYPIRVAKDAVLPIVNAYNPELEEIKKKGLRKSIAQMLWTRRLVTWGQVLGTSSTVPVHVFTRSDACGAGETFSAWFGKKQEDLRATAIFGDPGLASAVQRDNSAIGYSSIAYVYDQHTQKPFEKLTVIPIDINENGKIDPDEEFYKDSETLVRAISEGRYPSPPTRDLYLVTNGKPMDPIVTAFFKYILSKGQEHAQETGYIGLTKEMQEIEKAKLK